MERLKSMKETLMSCIEGQMTNLKDVDTEELGEAIDMVKDLSEAIYYCSIVKAMEEKEKENPQRMYFYERPYYPYPEYGTDEHKMYYGGGNNAGRVNSGSSSVGRGNSSSGGSQSSGSYYTEPYMGMGAMDVRHGRSPASRRMYMEAKEMGHKTPERMKELEHYLKDIAEDITEMIEDSSPEEKAMLQQKLSNIINKIK